MQDKFVIPDIVIFDTLNSIINYIRKNYNDVVVVGGGLPEDTLLYRLVTTLKLQRYILFDQIVSLLITKPEDGPKHIIVRTAYDSTSSSLPQIHITMPSENDRNNELSVGEGAEDEVMVDSGHIYAQFSRNFECTYYVVITTDNKNEMWILYHVIRAFLIAAQTHLELSGLLNVKFGGRDLSYTTEVPESMFMRAISLNFQYTQIVPDFFVQEVINKVTFIGTAVEL